MKSQFTSRLLAGLSAAALVSGLGFEANALTVRDDVTVEGSEELADNPIYDGVVQLFFVNKTTGGIFFNCTGSMVNARTVVSAAHCFNDFASTDYGLADEPFTLIVAYGPDTFDSLFAAPIILGQGFELDARNGYTWANQVIIHPDADPGLGFPLDFPGADVALISLNDPLANLPTYSMLFSQIPVGSHVQMIGYGGDGIGSTGDSGNIDGKRQAGENMLGLVGSQNDFLRGAFLSPTAGVFGNPDGDQLLYYTDFDNPDRDTSECRRETLFIGPNDLICDPGPFSPAVSADGTSVTSVNDSIDWFPGDALPNEAGTVGGDSGSPLFADEIVEGELLITGVLSGGFTFTSPQPSGYGDISYYNPLFLFHQFITEANPYKYVGTVAGDGNWSDEDHWVQLLDPGYLVIDDDGNVVNGLPEGPEEGAAGTDPREGVVFDTDINDVLPETGGGEGTGESASGQSGTLSAADYSADVQVHGVSATPEMAGNKSSNGILAANLAGTASTGASVASADAASSDVLSIAPVSLEANGALSASVESIDVEPELDTFLYGDIGTAGPWAGPGSTGAVPMNGINDGFFNYFDVTLGTSGTTTVDMDVIIDRLTISNGSATLNVAAEQTFISLIDTQISAGTLDVSGTFGSRDILNAGLVTGTETGLIVTDTLWNLGAINAGTGLTIAGDVVFTSGGALAYSGGTLAVDGNVSLDGRVGFASTAFGESGTLLTHTGERVGVFTAPGFSGVRQVDFTYGANQVDFEITAQAFTEFLGGENLTANQQSMAVLLDTLRATSYSDLQAVYDQVDFLTGAELVNSLTGLTPTDGFQTPGLSTVASAGVSSHLSSRFEAMRAGMANGTAFNARGSTMQLASLQSNELMGLIDQAEAASDEGGSAPKTSRNFGIFGEVSISTGSQEAGISGPESDIDGTTITIGGDGEVSEDLRLGVFASYSDGDSDFSSGLATSESDGFMVGAYGVRTFGDAQLSGYAGIGQRDFDTARVSSIGEALTGSTEADEIIAGVSLSSRYIMDASTGFAVVPEASFELQSFDISGYTENGGNSALVIDSRDYTSAQLKIGGDFHFYNTDDPTKSTLRPIIGLRVVQELDNDADSVLAEFAATPGQQVRLSGAERDEIWFEPRAALTFGSPTGVSGSLFVEGTVDRDDIEYTTFGFNVKSRF